MKLHDFPRPSFVLYFVSIIGTFVQKFKVLYKVQNMSILYIYNFLFFIFSSLLKYPYLKVVKKVCNRAKTFFVSVFIWFSLDCLGTISARFRHDLFKIALHSFFEQLYKIVPKIVRLLCAYTQTLNTLFINVCTKAHSFLWISEGGVQIYCRFNSINLKIPFAHGSIDCRR